MEYGMSQDLGALFSGGLSLFVVIILWSVFWKGLALWHSARRADTWWFVALLVFNTVGLLEILYLFIFAKRTLRTLFAANSSDIE